MAADPTHEERLHTNYNQVGVAVMQAMYSDDYLSIGGVESTAELARLAGVDATSRVLDIGCGVGGPVLHLAESIGCTVTGIDLVESNIDEARRRASDRGLDRLTSFERADATSLPFLNGSFDVVWGQDAWCHVPDKPAMLTEVARVLRPGGTVAFTDWLAGHGMTPTERRLVLDAALSTTAASAEGYLEMLAAAGFVDIAYTNIGATFTRQYAEICARLRAGRAELVARFGERVYEIVTDINDKIWRGFEGEAIGGGRFTAGVPER